MRVLITGGSRGIGKVISKTFIEHGHAVCTPSRTDLNLENFFSLKDPTFDIIINNAGINPLRPLTEINENHVMQVNYFAPLKIIQECIPYMIEQNFGRIVNIGSIWTIFAKQNRLAYSASKRALHGLTTGIAAEYSSHNILANTVSPGFINTELTANNNTPEQINQIIKTIPVNRLGNPQEVADLVYFLSAKNTYITGQNIVIDGGFTCTRN